MYMCECVHACVCACVRVCVCICVCACVCELNDMISGCKPELQCSSVSQGLPLASPYCQLAHCVSYAADFGTGLSKR